MGVGFGVNPEKQAGLGWIDQALERIGQNVNFGLHSTLSNACTIGFKCRFDRDFTYPYCTPQSQSQNLLIKDPPFIFQV